MRSLFHDNAAQVPFAVIGVFLLLISVIASINLVRMDVSMAKAISARGEISAPDNALMYAKADMARAINYAGMSALKQLGETPVIIPDNDSAYFNGTEGNIVEFDHNRAKAMIRHSLNKYIESNYRYDTFAFQGYSVNAEPIDSWDAIEIQPIRMKLDRTLIPPVMPPGENGYDTYWKVQVPLRIHLTDLSSGTELTASNITIETLITARYPLLKDLTDEYSMRVNGSNAVMIETTAFSMAYTWARGYMQYYRNTPDNII
ncbi:MAG: hypothetical protein Q8O17_02880, partial [Candidatus Methanoperedens sp.]|nr:hypothetical protein [Candidatus Methanoperedens sp.]